MGLFFDWDGKEIDRDRWVELLYQPRHVGETDLGELGRVSTVWLGINFALAEDTPPVIFETMVFGGPMNEEIERYCTKEQAAAGHEFMVMRLTTLAEIDHGL